MLLCALLLLLSFAGALCLAFWLPRALAPAAVLERLVSLAAALCTFFRGIPEQSKTERMLLLLLLPWPGALLCFLAGGDPAPRGAPSPAPFGGVAGAVSSLASRGCAFPGCRAETAEYFPTGSEMAKRLLEDLAEAKSEIVLDYYLLARGNFLGAVLKILGQKAESGVDVRLFYDDFGSATLPKRFARELAAKGIGAAAFHPVRAFPPGRLNRRDHRKIAVIDRRVAYTGGVNLADEYIGERIRFGNWKDSAVRLTGEPAVRLRALCLGGDVPPSAAEEGIPCVVFGDGAAGSARTGEQIFTRIVFSAERSLFLCTPYLAPREGLLSALKAAAAAGTDVRIMIPHIPDKRTVFLLTRSYARELEGAGVKVFEYAGGFLHAKSLAADGRYAAVGSYNLDARSFRFQAECAVFLEDERLTGELVRDFLSMWETGVPVPKASRGERLLGRFLRLFAGWI